MSILCGSDFSPGADHAVRTAAAFARAFGEPLVLAHVVDSAALGWARDAVAMQCTEAASRGLAEVAARCIGPDLDVTMRVELGAPDEELAALAREHEVRLLVIGLLGWRSAARARVGSVATRLAHAAPVPVLLVRDAGPFEACAGGARPLRVLLGVDLSSSTDASVAWLATLARLGPCELVLQHFYDPLAERRRLGLHGPVRLHASDPEVERMLQHELRARIGDPLGSGAAELRVSARPAWIGEGLIETAEREHFDLIVVGGRRRGGLAAIRHESVSERVLRMAPTAVLRVPVEIASERPLEIARLTRVLVTTDLSERGNQAIPYAYAFTAPGGIVHLMHVIEERAVPSPLYAHYVPGKTPTPEERAAQERAIEAQLRALVPAEAERRGTETCIEIANAQEVGEAIRVAAERLAVDAVCIATHGRSGLSRLVAGSVASDVAASCKKPVVLVRPPPED